MGGNPKGRVGGAGHIVRGPFAPGSGALPKGTVGGAGHIVRGPFASLGL